MPNLKLKLNRFLFRTFGLWGPDAFYGNCYAFNFGEASRSVAIPGPGYGLSLVLNIEKEHYGGVTEAEGVR